MSRINDVEDPQAGETDITVKQTFQKILEDAFPPKYTTYKHTKIQTYNFYRENGPNKKTTRDVIEWMMSIINNAENTDITVKQAFETILKADLPQKYTIY